MNKLVINKDKLIKLSNFKTRLVAGLLGIATVLTISSCGSKKKEIKDNKASKTGEVASNSMNINSSYTLEKLNNKVSNLSQDIDEKFFLNEDDKKTTITILNIDYILTKNSDLLKQLYPNGLNSDKELKDYETYISKYREYNTTIEDVSEFLTLSQYAESEKDKSIISTLEELTKELINLSKTNTNKSRIEEIFNLMDKFYSNKTINVNGVKIDKDDLSNGYNVASEVFGQITSVYTKEFVSKKRRKALDEKLFAKDRINRIAMLLETFGNNKENIINQYVEGENIYILTEEDNKVINQYNSLCESIFNELNNKNISISENEIKDVVIIANIDYLASDYVSAGVLKSLVGDRNIESILKNATSFVEKVENYNKKNKDTSKFYKYNIFMNSSSVEQVVNSIAIKGALYTTNGLRSTVKDNITKEGLLNNKYYNAIKLYNQYSNDVAIKSADGKKITKNDTGMGTRYITDAIYLKALKEMPSQIKTINNLVNNTNKDLSSINGISWAIDNKCSEYEFVK